MYLSAWRPTRRLTVGTVPRRPRHVLVPVRRHPEGR